MMRIALGCGLLGVVACGDASSLPTALRPGPCSSVDSIEGDAQSCTMTYDDADRIVAITCVYPIHESAGQTYQDTTDWSFGWDGDRLTAIGVEHFDDVELGYDTGRTRHDFVFAADRVTATAEHFRPPTQMDRTEIYEADLVLARHRFETHEVDGYTTKLGESARDGLVESHQVVAVEVDETVTDHTYTYDGPAHQGTRTQTRDDGVEEVFEYDAQGRLVSSTTGPQLEYDGDLLVRVGLVVYEHDDFGNLLRRIDGDNVTTYDYACWE